ncbi:MAG: signal peptidase I [Defluviitaleaceae bacterium]|nr:signal peptidase I [Defluviitaleaceae bacterium]
MKIFKTKFNRLNHVLDVVLITGVLAAILYFTFWPSVILGGSMSPTFSPGDRIIISRIAAISGFSRGDLVMSRIPIDGYNMNMVKRIYGIPGDFVNFGGGILLGDGEYFIVGDNLANSIDSRHFGPINQQQITARVLFRYFPVNIFRQFY